MSKDIYFKQKFYCKKCDKIESIYIWLSEIDNVQKHTCGKKLELVVENVVEGFSIGGKHQNGRPKIEKRNRATNHFKKDILPTLSPVDQAYFKVKHRKKK